MLLKPLAKLSYLIFINLHIMSMCKASINIIDGLIGRSYKMLKSIISGVTWILDVYQIIS